MRVIAFISTFTLRPGEIQDPRCSFAEFARVSPAGAARCGARALRVVYFRDSPNSFRGQKEASELSRRLGSDIRAARANVLSASLERKRERWKGEKGRRSLRVKESSLLPLPRLPRRMRCGGRKGEGEKEPNLIRKITVFGGTRCKIAQPFTHR